MTHDAPVPTLARLIRTHQDATGDSYADISRKTRLSKGKIGQLARPDQTYLVRQETLEKLAHGLGLPMATVQRAALGTAGFADKEVQRATAIQLVVDKLETLDDDTVALVSAIVDVIAAHR
jgi:hypothetical protein